MIKQLIQRHQFMKVILLLMAFILAGCSLIPGPPPKLYTLDALPSPSTPDVKSLISVVVDTPTLHTAINNGRISLRAAPLSVDYYADVAWADRLSDLIRESIIYSFQNSGRVSASFGLNSGIRADYLVSVEVREFDINYFNTPNVPLAEVHYYVQLIDNLSRNVIASKNFQCFHPVKDEAIESIVGALNDCHLKVIQKLIDWVVVFGNKNKLE